MAESICSEMRFRCNDKIAGECSKRGELVLLGACLLASCAQTPQKPIQRDQLPVSAAEQSNIQDAHEYLRKWAANGGSGSVLIGINGRIVLEQGYGFADRSSHRPVTSETLFDIGSLVKLFTETAILQLASRGEISLSDRLDAHFEKVPEDKRGITIHQILEHRAGLADIVDAEGKPIEFMPEVDFLPLTRQGLVKRIFSAPLVAVPGQEENYSNFGYGLLGVIIEKVSGKTYEDYIRINILEPAGMQNTGYSIPPGGRGDMAVGYRGATPWGTSVDFADPTWPSWILKASGGMLSSPQDMFLFIEALRDGRLLSSRAFDGFLALEQSVSPSGKPYVIAFGSNDIFWAGVFWDRSKDSIVVVYTSDSEHPANEVMQELIRLL